MAGIDRLVLTFLLNAAWQVPVVVLGAALLVRLLGRLAARHRHALWEAAAVLCLLLPLSSLQEPAAQVPEIHPPAPLPEGEYGAELPFPEREGSVVAALLVRVQDAVAERPWMPRTVVAGYGVFLLAGVAHLLLGWRGVTRLRRSGRQEPCAPAEAVGARCAAVLGTEMVPLRWSSGVSGPCTIGTRRPVILLPPFLREADASLLTVVLGHELAHIDRRDALRQWLVEAALLPLRFHPAVRLLRREWQDAREQACDERVAGHLLPTRTYVRVLVQLAEWCMAAPAPALGLFGASGLEGRVGRLLRGAPPWTSRVSACLSALALAGLLSAAGVAAASAWSLELERPDLSGEWRAESLRRCTRDPVPAVDTPLWDVGETIRRDGRVLRIRSRWLQGDSTQVRERDVQPDGQERAEAGQRRVMSRWWHGMLVTAWTATSGEDRAGVEVRSLSPDGRHQNVELYQTMPQGTLRTQYTLARVAR